jgi:hypothetical protein
VDPLGVGTYQTIVPPRVGADGTTWVHLVTGNPPDDECAPDHIHLARLDDEGWTAFSGPDGVVPLLSSGDSRALLRVDHSGAVWVRPMESPWGVRVFDGRTWRGYLDGLGVDNMEIAPDGNVWVLTTDGLYVITPEAESPPISDLMPGVDPVTGEVEPGRYLC